MVRLTVWMDEDRMEREQSVFVCIVKGVMTMKENRTMSLTGNEEFVLDGKPVGMHYSDFWRFRYSNIYDFQGEIAEFVVAKALGKENADNTAYWTLFDINYRDRRIEVKETSYYHSWNEEGKISSRRGFEISKANSSYEDENEENKYERQNDIYVFCLNTGNTREESYPLNLNNWEFYVVPTEVIDDNCGNNKSISIGRIKKLGYVAKQYDEIKGAVDEIIDVMELTEEDYKEIYRKSRNHKKQLEKDSICGCFYCEMIFQPTEIVEWCPEKINGKDCTAICPYCDIDAVIGESSGYKITRELLRKLNKIWFSKN